MTIADPQAIVINAVTKNLVRLGGSDTTSSYRLDDGTDVWGLEVSHASTRGRVRHLLKVTDAKIAADVYQPDINTISKMSAHVVLDVPVVGFTSAQQSYLFIALADKLRADGDLLISKLINGET